MMLAASQSGERFPASPGARAFCPTCNSEVIAKCGEVKVWHWAHQSLKDCDVWSEPESEWHYNWKVLAGIDNTEIVISNALGDVHRADIKVNGRVIELQHSTLSTREVRERENFYGTMIWVIDGSSIGDFRLERWFSSKGKPYYKLDKIKRSWVLEITKPVFFHFESLFFQYTNRWEDAGYGRWRKVQEPTEPEAYSDVLVKWSNQKFAAIISKKAFCENILGEF